VGAGFECENGEGISPMRSDMSRGSWKERISSEFYEVNCRANSDLLGRGQHMSKSIGQ